MDKVARIVQLLLGNNNIPSSSFKAHKDYFLRATIPYLPNEDYAKIVREETDRFDNFLKASRDKIMIHSDVPWSGVRSSPTRGIQFVRANELSGAIMKEESEFMISLKRKYVEKYPQLQEVPDNLCEIIKFFMIIILHKTGSTLPPLHYLAKCVLYFQKQFARAFETYF